MKTCLSHSEPIRGGIPTAVKPAKRRFQLQQILSQLHGPSWVTSWTGGAGIDEQSETPLLSWLRWQLFHVVSRVYDKCVLRCAVAYALGCVDCGDNGWHVFEKHETESNATYLVKAGDRAFKVPCPQPQRCLPGQELQSPHRIAMASAVAFACCGLAVYQVITAYCICILTEFCMYYAHFRGLSEYRSQAEDALSEHLAASWLNHL